MADTEQDALKNVEIILKKHVNFLKELGMVVNESKTEIMTLNFNENQTSLSVTVAGVPCQTVKQMKALGIMIDDGLKWDCQAEASILKGQRLLSVFKHLRKYMTEDKILKSCDS